MYAIIDTETTGISAKNEKITEIAILIFDGKNIMEKYHTLINPEKSIPYRITQLTGINNQMVASAPKFYEVAKDIIRLTEGKIIIGHNVTFDYNFIRAEFNEFDYDFRRKTMCTVKLSRKAFPGFPSYSLGKLTSFLGVNHSQKHRAMGDAEATLEVFRLILAKSPDLLDEPIRKLPKALNDSIINSIPDSAGVYYFLDSLGKIIYVGKSKHIRQRILSHLNNHSTKKAVEMIDNINDIKFIETGSELIALLFESEEIKRIKPLYNRAQLRSVFSYGLFLNEDENGYFDLKIGKNEPLSHPLTTFSSAREAKDYLQYLVDEYNLCLSHCDLQPGKGPCFNFQIHKCLGACCGEESVENYNKRLKVAIDRLQFRHSNFILIEPGRNENEYGIVEVKSGAYFGYGYIEKGKINSKSQRDKCVHPGLSNRDSNNIVRNWIRNQNYEMIVNE